MYLICATTSFGANFISYMRPPKREAYVKKILNFYDCVSSETPKKRVFYSVCEESIQKYDNDRGQPKEKDQTSNHIQRRIE